MDHYSGFSQLAAGERCGTDFQVRVRRRDSSWVILAPHGGAIEPGTSEVASAVAEDDLNFYAFEGLKVRDNKRLHITSTRFDEPVGVSLVAETRRALSVHGEDSDEPLVLLGGRDMLARRALGLSLLEHGFTVAPAGHGLEGREPANICNRCGSGAGLQIELSRGLRQMLFSSLSRQGRTVTTERFEPLVLAIRHALVADVATDRP